MLTNRFRFLHPVYLDEEMSRRLRDLAVDVDQIRQGAGPTPAALAESPLLIDWTATLAAAGIRLKGTAIGHPGLENGPIMTSPIWVADPLGKWVRTLSRYYRLGRPMSSEEQTQDDDDEFRGGR